MKIYRLSAKTYRDVSSHDSVTLYHVSPNKLNRFMPRSTLLDTGKVGLFFSPNYNSLIQDWMPYVKGIKDSKHPLEKSLSSMYDELDKLEEISNRSEEIENRIVSLKERIDKMREKREGDPHVNTKGGYKTLYIHTVKCPKEIYELAKSDFNETYENDPVKSFGFWAWGQQIFIEDKYLPELQIVKVKRLNESDYHDEYKNVSLNRYVQDRSYEWKKQMERDDMVRKQKELEKAEKANENPNRYDYFGEKQKKREEFQKKREAF